MTHTRNSGEFLALQNEILSYEIEEGKYTNNYLNQWHQVAVNPVVIISNQKFRPTSQLQFGGKPVGGFKDIDLSGDSSLRLQFRAERPQTQQMFHRTNNKLIFPLNPVSNNPSQQENYNSSKKGFFRGKKLKQSSVQLGQNLNRVNQPLEQWVEPLKKTMPHLIPSQKITLTEVREALNTNKLNSSDTKTRARSILYKKRPKANSNYSGFFQNHHKISSVMQPIIKAEDTGAAQLTEYLKYEVIQSLVNKRLPSHYKEQKLLTPEKQSSQLEVMGLYKELLCLQAREKKALQKVQEVPIEHKSKGDFLEETEVAHDIVVIPLAQKTRNDSTLSNYIERQSLESPDLKSSLVVENNSTAEFYLQPTVITSNVAPGSQSRVPTERVAEQVISLDLKQHSPDFKQQHALERISLMIDRKQYKKYKGNQRGSVLGSKIDRPNTTQDQFLKTSQQIYNQRILLQSRDIKYSMKPFRVMKFDPKADYNKYGLALFGDSDPVSDFKQRLLVEKVLTSFSDDLNGQLRSFKVFCKFNPMMGLEKGQFTQCVTIVTFGADSLISNCCSQLICFQFIKALQRLEAQCLGSKCKHNPLTSSTLDLEFLALCFETPNEVAQLRHRSTRSSQVSIPAAYQTPTIFNLAEPKNDFLKTAYVEFKQKRSIICKVPKVIQNLERITTKDVLSGVFTDQMFQVQGVKSQCHKHRSIHSKRPSISNQLNADILKVIKVDQSAGQSGRQTSKSQSHQQMKEGDGEDEEHHEHMQSKRLMSRLPSNYARDLPSGNLSRADSRKQKTIHSQKNRTQLTHYSLIGINREGFENV